MNRVLILGLGLVLVLGVCGCQLFEKRTVEDEEAESGAMEDVSAGEEAEGAEVKPVAQPTTPDEPGTAPPTGAGRTHVVKGGDTLYKLARQYYDGDQSMWRKIWEANRDKVPDPNALKVGTELIIP